MKVVINGKGNNWRVENSNGVAYDGTAGMTFIEVLKFIKYSGVSRMLRLHVDCF